MSPNQTENGDTVQAAVQEVKAHPVYSHANEVYEKLLKVIPPGDIDLEPSESSEPSQAVEGRVYHYFAMGGYADVYKGVLNAGSAAAKMVAIKVFRGAHLKRSDSEKKEPYAKRLRREYAVWGELRHRNILPLEGLVTHPALPSAGLVSEFKIHGNLVDFMKNAGLDCDRLLMAQGVACGLEYLHSKEVVHGDLTPANVLVDQDAETQLFFPLITDFGKSRILEKEGYTTSMNKTPALARPPELLQATGKEATNKDFLTPASDVYSFSLLLLLLVTGEDAYSHGTDPDWVKISQVVAKSSPLRPVPALYPVLHPSYEFCWPLMRACWRPERQDRITSQQAHDWLRSKSPGLN